MRNFTKWMALALVIVMCVGVFAGCTPNPTEPQKTEPQQTQPQGTTPPVTVPPVDEMTFTGSPTLEGDAADRLPVKEDVYISVADATGAALEIGVYGGEINVKSGGGSWRPFGRP